MFLNLIKVYRSAFRHFIRSRTRPKTVEEAEEKRLFWAKIYAASGFLCFTYCIYRTYKDGLDFNYRKDIPRDLAVAEQISKYSDKVSVYHGFTKVGEYDLKNLKEEDFKSLSDH